MTAIVAARDVVFLLLAGAAGSLLVRTGSDLTLEEALGWSWGGGMLLLSSLYALLLAVHASPGPKKLGALLLLVAGVSATRRRPRRLPAPPWSGVALLMAAAAAGIALYALQACAEPLWSTDFLAIWGLKGKTIYSTGSIPGRLFHDPATAWSHPEYPLLLPLLMAAFSAATGGWNDEALGLVFVFCQIAAVLVVAGYCRRHGSPAAGALAAVLVAFWYPLYRAFHTGLAEIPFALFLVLLATAAADENTPRSALAALLCVATKQEGTVFALLVAGTLVVLRRPARNSRRTAAAIAAVTILHFVVLRLARGDIHDRDFTFRVLSPSRATELFGRVGRLARAFAGAWTPVEILGLACLAGVLLATRRAREDFLLLPLAVQLSIYLGACALSSWDPVWQLRSAFFRIAATLGPVLALVIGCRLAQGKSRSGARVTRDSTGPAGPSRVAAWACGGLLVAAGALYLATAIAAPKETAYGKWDLEILQRWGVTGILAPLPDLPDHLLKSGYILYLRAILGATAPFPIGRILIANALLAVAAFAAVAFALWKTRRFRAALLAAAFFLFFAPLRDCADDVLSELPAAAGLLGCLALLVLAVERREILFPVVGLLAALLALLRPNVGELAVVIGAVAAAGTPRGLRKAAALVGCFIAGTALVTGMGRWKNISLNPLSVEASTPLLWGAADYYWKPDVGAWPSGLDAAEKGRAERSAAARLWKAKVHRWSRDDRRALLWKLGHAVLSSEQLPPRWRPPAYLAYDKAIRRWWWLAALALLSASAVAAAGSRGPWRLAPALIAAAIVAQGAVFGADPRFALPLVPAWWVVLLLALPGSVLSPRTVAAGTVSLAAFAGLLAAVPDVSTSDYAVVRGPAPLSFAVPASAFARTGDRATIHVRFLELSQKFDRGLTIETGGREIARYEPDPARPYPAFLSAVVDGKLLETARRAGLAVDILPLGAADWNFFFFPVIPPPWASPATIAGETAIESGYGGATRGGIPWWVHAGSDSAP